MMIYAHVSLDEKRKGMQKRWAYAVAVTVTHRCCRVTSVC